MSDNDIARWIHHLQTIAGRCAGDAKSVPGARAIAPILDAALAGRAERAPEPCPAGDVGLWWCVVDDSIDPDVFLHAGTAGSLFDVDRFKALEVWTESELSGLHALDAVAARRRGPALHGIVRTALEWHLEHTQPDNATNRPWALHVFLRHGTPESRLYAETLLHNCMAIEGVPDPFSALILKHTASEMSKSSADRGP